MRKIFLAFALISIFNFHFSMADAQNEGAYNESVLVRGSYRPVIEQSEKINFPAVITDTMPAVERSFLYTINPTRLRALYEPSRIKAARIIGEPTTKLYNNYIRVGMGNYWSPLLDLYWSSTRDTKKTFGVRLNHRSSWSSITDYGTNHFGVTGVTLFGKYIVKDLLQISSDINFEHDHNLYYGFSDSTLGAVMPTLSRDDLELSSIRAKYNVLTWNIGLRNMELDANKLGYAANVRLSDLWASWEQNEFNLNVTGDIHYGFNIKDKYRGVAYLRVEWDGYSHAFEPDGEMPLGFKPATADTLTGHRNIVKVNPYADFMFEGLMCHAGFTAGWDAFSTDHGTIFRFFPDVVVSKKLLEDNLALSLGATGGIDANNWNIIRQVNPYVVPGAEQRATRHYDFAAHARWTLSKKLEANAEVSYSLLLDDLNFALDTNYSLSNVFRTHYLDNNRLTIGASLSFVNDEMLQLVAAAHYYHYNLTGDDSVMLYRPDWDVLFSANLNYEDRWLFRLETRLVGKVQADNGEELPTRFGLNAQVEYRHNRALSFFLKMDNMAFQRQFYWAHYPSQRALFLLGLTYTIPHK